MKKDNIDNVFKKLQDDFDFETPSLNHKANFLNKLEAQNNTKNITSKTSIWKPLLGVAASILLIVTLVFNFNTNTETKDLASVSPEMAQTQSFFTSVINQELEKIKTKRTPETELLIKDALIQLELLEKEYKQLKIDLTDSGNDKRVIHAMINNFMNRVDLLKSVLENIEETKNLKQTNNETTITL